MQVGPSKLILRAYLTNLSMDVVYGTFILHHLKLQPSQGSACETVLVYMTSLANLILVMPTEDAQPDDRLQRPALWHTSQASKQQGPGDLVVPQAPPQLPAIVPSKEASAPLQHKGSSETMADKLVTAILTRAQALSSMRILVMPPDGLALVILQDTSRPESQRHAALQLLTAVYSCASNPVVADADAVAHCCKLHYTAFTEAYAAEDAQLARQHLAALQALAKHKVSYTVYALESF